MLVIYKGVVHYFGSPLTRGIVFTFGSKIEIEYIYASVC